MVVFFNVLSFYGAMYKIQCSRDRVFKFCMELLRSCETWYGKVKAGFAAGATAWNVLDIFRRGFLWLSECFRGSCFEDHTKWSSKCLFCSWILCLVKVPYP